MNDAPRQDEELGEDRLAPSTREAEDQPAAAPKQKPDLFRGDEVEVADILVKRLTEEHGESPVCDRAKLWGYEEAVGTWQPLPESELACEVYNFSGKRVAAKDGTRPMKISHGFKEGVVKMVKDKVTRPASSTRRHRG